jgi:DNA-binding LacI/PurR family transcriptional regulator
MVKLVDVAELARVSRGTASNVFAHPELVSEELKERVLAAAAELGYGGPNPSGRLLRLGKVDAIGVTPPGSYGVSVAFSNSYFREFLTGVGEICDERGASLTVISGVGADKTRGIKNALVDGFILHQIEDAALVEARRRSLPLVVIDLDGDKETNSVRINDREGGRLAAAHLTKLGHRRLAIFSVLRHGTVNEAPAASLAPVFHLPAEGRDRLPGGFAIDHDRLAGYADALAEAGLSIDEMPVIECGAETVANAANGARLFFDRMPDATAVLAMTDIQAIAVIEEAQRRGLAVPGDLSVVGFDDIPEARLVTPTLTTIAHPIVEKGRTAARVLFEAKRTRHIRLPVSLLVRASTAAPRPSRAKSAKRNRAGR